MMKVVVFVDGKDAYCTDEVWRRYQIFLPDIAYKELKKILNKIDKKYDC